MKLVIWKASVATVNSLLEMMSILILVESMQDVYEKRSKIRIIVYILASSIMFAINLNVLNRAAFLLCYLLFAMLIFVEGGKNKCRTLICLCIGVLLVSLMELIAYVPIGAITNLFALKYDISFLAIVLVVLCCHLIREKDVLLLIQRWFQGKEKNVYIGILLATVIVAFPLVFSKFNMGLSFVEGIYLIIILSVIMFAIYRVEIYRRELLIRNTYEGKYNEAIELIRARQHKFMNQLDSIYLLFQLYDNYDELVEKQSEALEHLKEYLMPNKVLVLDRPMVITHVYSKMCEAGEKGITLNTDFSCSLHEIKIPDIMLIEIIGNLLDNALDEVEQRKQNEKIFFKIYQEGPWSVIEVCNEHPLIPHAEYKSFFEQGYSTKGVGRGTGLSYIKKIVNKYAGKLEVGNRKISNVNCFSIKVFVK